MRTTLIACAAAAVRSSFAMLDAGKLKRLLPDFEPDALPIQVVYPHARLLSPNVRAFVDFAVPRLRK